MSLIIPAPRLYTSQALIRTGFCKVPHKAHERLRTMTCQPCAPTLSMQQYLKIVQARFISLYPSCPASVQRVPNHPSGPHPGEAPADQRGDKAARQQPDFKLNRPYRVDIAPVRSGSGLAATL